MKLGISENILFLDMTVQTPGKNVEERELLEFLLAGSSTTNLKYSADECPP